MHEPLAGDSAITTFFLPMDLRNSRMPSRLSAWLAQSGTLMMTLLGLRMTRLLPMAAAISFLNGSRDLKAMLARSSPEASETRLLKMPLADAGAVAVMAAIAMGRRQAVAAAAPPMTEVLRKSLREAKPLMVMISIPLRTRTR